MAAQIAAWVALERALPLEPEQAEPDLGKLRAVTQAAL
jgi:hypothetical protein